MTPWMRWHDFSWATAMRTVTLLPTHGDAGDIAQLIDALGGAAARHACAEAVLTATTWWP
jgi:hypothetical protein